MTIVTPFVRRQFATLSILFSLALSVGLVPQSTEVYTSMRGLSTGSVVRGDWVEDRFFYSDATYTTQVGHRQTNFCTRETTMYGQETQFYKTKYTRCYY